MPGAIEDRASPPIVDPASATDEEIHPAVDRDRIRVVCSHVKCGDRALNKANNMQLAGSTDTAASFQIDGEDHTLGNALRYVIMKK